jgi:hypothetical protein
MQTLYVGNQADPEERTKISVSELLQLTPREADRLARAVTMYLEMTNGSRVANEEHRRRFDEMVAAREAIEHE